jgi:hypothetical protein
MAQLIGEVLLFVRLHVAFHKTAKHGGKLLSHSLQDERGRPAAKTAQHTSQIGGKDWLPYWFTEKLPDKDYSLIAGDAVLHRPGHS